MSDSIIATNQVKRRLQADEFVAGTMVCELRQPSVMQLLVNAGFDFMIIDNEHGPFNIETIADLSRTAKYVGLTPLVRVPNLTYAYVAQSLDAGAQGIMVPRVYSKEQAEQAVQMMKYPPVGIRGSALSRGYTNFKSGPAVETMARVNEETLLIIQVETAEAVENIEEIVTIPGVDVALIGPHDLSIALGVPGQLDAPEMHQALETTIVACQQHGVYPALHINDLELAAYWKEKGMRMLSSFSEAGLMVRGGLEVTSALKK